MPKERTINPAQAAHKAEKAKSLKKAKQEQQTRRNEKLSRRNPERLQRQIDDLKAIEKEGGTLRPKDKQTLEVLERDLKAVRRAREHLGDAAPVFGKPRDGDGGVQKRAQQNSGAKRRRDEQESETDEDVRAIPMPRDTPPPLPRREPKGLPTKPVVLAPAQTVYSSAPVIRDLAQESKRFVPAAVAQNLAKIKGHGGKLLEEDELDRLEKAGYRDSAAAAKKEVTEAVEHASLDAQDTDINNELKNVEMEEVPDEDL